MNKLRAIVLGAGYRGRAYAEYAKDHPDQLEIVGVADPVQAQSIPAKMYWNDWRECLDSHPEADIVMITMPDDLHYEPALTALKAGYHLLLEKPISPTEAECREVIDCALKHKRLVVIGHILRYTAYFAHIKALIDSGELGEVVSIAHQESAGFWKVAHSYVRGNWANSKKSSPIILAKCSHDIDLFVWWIGKKCKKVSSFGSIKLFRREMMPKGAACRCVDCPPEIEKRCVWSALNMYVNHDELKYLFADRSEAAMRRLIEETEYGKCVYQADNDVPDHQTVTMEFEGGATVSHVMTGFTAQNIRTTRIALTRGEILGDGENLDICRFDGNAITTGVPLNYRLPNRSRHGGGDFNIVSEMIRMLRRGDPDEIRETTEQALQSHLICFAAEKSRLDGGKVVEIN
ncbi:MAG: Gfo/Idh/MocA family oxidoreductase [Kiritimatiellae bacterium]|jgi:predicted dehydrogenase|nr:Gfo/Idh/MocA family oxidoreductase [Kiritimatiellia bacterium]